MIWKRRQSTIPFEELAKRDDTSAVIGAISYVSAKESSEQLSKLFSFIEERLERLPVSALRNLDSEVRRTMWSSYLQQVTEPSHVELLVSASSSALAPLAICLMHGNGYIREEAVRQIGRHKTGTAIPFLLLRTTDWVPQIRIRAATTVSEMVTPQFASDWIRSLPLVVTESSRAQPELRTRVEHLLTQPECASALLSAMRVEQSLTRRSAATLALRNSKITATDLLAAVADQSDALTSTIIVEGLLERLNESAQLELLLKLVADRRIRMRRLGLIHLGHRYPEQAAPYLDYALSDSKRSIRRVAQRALISQDIDVAERYRDLMEQNPYVALLGLAELRSLDDAAAPSFHIESSEPQVRKAAVAAASALDPIGYQSELSRALIDTFPGTSSAAQVGLKKTRMSSGELWADLMESHDEIVRRNVMRVSLSQPFWIRLELIVRAAASKEEILADWGMTALRDTPLSQVPPEPPEETKVSILEAWPIVKTKVPDLAKQFEFAMSWLRSIPA